jgi:DNA-binding Lrp family transcriptional regulator
LWTPDDLDIKIIRALASPHSFQWDVRISYARIAEQLKVDEETVRNRLKRMNDAQFLRGWQLILNPVLLGRSAAIVEMKVAESESKGEVISRLKLLEGVMLIDDFYGRELAVLTLYDNAAMLDRQVQLFASLCGGSPPPPSPGSSVSRSATLSRPRRTGELSKRFAATAVAGCRTSRATSGSPHGRSNGG